MGLFGAIIVRPTGFDLNDPAKRTAYGHPDTAFAREYLAFLSEMDHRIHEQVALGRITQVDTTTFWAVYWFINGRTGPDTMDKAFAEWMPTQPYNCAPRLHPGEKILIRIVGAGPDLHPFHTHGNHLRVIARDGRLLESAPGTGLTSPPFVHHHLRAGPDRGRHLSIDRCKHRLGHLRHRGGKPTLL